MYDMKGHFPTDAGVDTLNWNTHWCFPSCKSFYVSWLRQRARIQYTENWVLSRNNKRKRCLPYMPFQTAIL